MMMRLLLSLLVLTCLLQVWNIITVQGKTMQEAVSDWWLGTSPTANKFYADAVWDATGKPPSSPNRFVSRIAQSALNGSARAPVVPWYTARWLSNPSCRGFPWY